MVTELCQSCYFNVLKYSSETNFILAQHDIIGTTWLAVIEDGNEHRQTRGALLNARRFGGLSGAGKHLGFASIHSHLHYLCPRGTKFTEGIFLEQSTFFAPRARPGNFFAHRTINYKLQNKWRGSALYGCPETAASFPGSLILPLQGTVRWETLCDGKDIEAPWSLHGQQGTFLRNKCTPAKNRACKTDEKTPRFGQNVFEVQRGSWDLITYLHHTFLLQHI